MADKKTPPTRKAPATKAKPALKTTGTASAKSATAKTESPDAGTATTAKTTIARAQAPATSDAATSSQGSDTAKTDSDKAGTKASDKAVEKATPDAKADAKPDAKPASPKTDTPAPSAKSDAATDATTETAKPDSAAKSPTAKSATSKSTTAEESHSMLVPVPDPAPRRSGFGGLVLGGIIAALIGAGAAYVVLPRLGLLAQVDSGAETRDILTQLKAHDTRLSGLDDRLDAPRDTTDVDANTAAVGDLGAQIAAISDTLAAAESRLTALEDRPAVVDSSGEGSGPSLGDIAALRQSLAEQQAQITSLISEAAHQEELALASSRATLQRAAMTRIHTALDSGVAFAAPLADLEALGQSIPDDLQRAAATGVPTLTALQETYPEAARAALATARKDSEGTGGMMGFLSSQLGVRSLEPREGNDPDAILSRAEAALSAGRLNDALAEIGALPETARAELSDWAGLATSRLTAVHAAQALGANLN